MTTAAYFFSQQYWTTPMSRDVSIRQLEDEEQSLAWYIYQHEDDNRLTGFPYVPYMKRIKALLGAIQYIKRQRVGWVGQTEERLKKIKGRPGNLYTAADRKRDMDDLRAICQAHHGTPCTSPRRGGGGGGGRRRRVPNLDPDFIGWSSPDRNLKKMKTRTDPPSREAKKVPPGVYVPVPDTPGPPADPLPLPSPPSPVRNDTRILRDVLERRPAVRHAIQTRSMIIRSRTSLRSGDRSARTNDDIARLDGLHATVNGEIKKYVGRYEKAVIETSATSARQRQTLRNNKEVVYITSRRIGWVWPRRNIGYVIPRLDGASRPHDMELWRMSHDARRSLLEINQSYNIVERSDATDQHIVTPMKPPARTRLEPERIVATPTQRPGARQTPGARPEWAPYVSDAVADNYIPRETLVAGTYDHDAKIAALLERGWTPA